MNTAKIPSIQLIICLILLSALMSCAPPKLTTDGVEAIQKAAHRGEADFQVLIGEIYEFGTGVPANPLIAAQWYQLAAKRENPQAQFYLGIFYLTGHALKQSPSEAVKWLFKAGEHGHERAQGLLAILYLKDRDLRPEFARRIVTYRQLAEKGDVSAQYTLAWIYRVGVGTAPNMPEALQWLQKAAQKGHIKAQLALGEFYLDEKTMTPNAEEAMKWLEKSAQADLKAQIRLCRMYQGLKEYENKAPDCLKSADRKIDSMRRFYIEMQYALLNSEIERHPVLAHRACERISQWDPSAGKISEPCGVLERKVGGFADSDAAEARKALEQKDWQRFGRLVDRLITPELDLRHMTPLIAAAWSLNEEENSAALKAAQDQLRALEALSRSVSYRTGNAAQIHKLITSFRETIAQGQRDYPEDTAFALLLRKGNKIIASIQQKLKAPAPPPARGKALTEPSEDAQEEADPGEESFNKAQELFNSGRFGEAEAFFEKTTRTRGSKYIASSYIYLGISHLARINPAHVSDARKRELKGLASFQNALRFDPGISLPAGYDKYQPVFNKAKEQLR
jgi:TPR repeat protein